MEQESPEDIWTSYERGHYVVVPTNGVVKRSGEAVMGAGLALDVARRWDWFPALLGRWITDHGSRVFVFANNVIDDPLRVFTFPVKEDWRLPARLDLVQRSAVELRALAEDLGDETEMNVGEIYLPRVGCGAGGLRWTDVRPTLRFALERSRVTFIVVHK